MRVALLAIDPLYRDALAALIGSARGLEMIGGRDRGADLLLEVKDKSVAVLVVIGRGLPTEELRYILGAKTYGSFGVVYVEGDEPLADSERAEVDVYLAGSLSGKALLESIAVAGEHVRPMAPTVRERGRGYGQRPLLTQRELQIAELVAQGFSNRRIAETLSLGEQSVKNYVSIIMRKLHLENRVQVALRLSGANATESA